MLTMQQVMGMNVTTYGRLGQNQQIPCQKSWLGTSTQRSVFRPPPV